MGQGMEAPDAVPLHMAHMHTVGSKGRLSSARTVHGADSTAVSGVEHPPEQASQKNQVAAAVSGDLASDVTLSHLCCLL